MQTRMPQKSQLPQAPFYLSNPSTPYCHSCGRVIGNRKSDGVTSVKFCSDKCKRNKPKEQDRGIEDALKQILQGGADGAKSKGKKGDARVVVRMSEIQAAFFGGQALGKKTKRGGEEGEWKSVDMVEGYVTDRRNITQGQEEDFGIGEDGGVSIDDNTPFPRAPVAGEGHEDDPDLPETDEMRRKRLQGQKRADEVEQVKRAARRAVIFGLEVPQEVRTKPSKKGKRHDDDDEAEEPTTTMKKCEALMGGKVVEPSFAKGDWAVRWREE